MVFFFFNDIVNSSLIVFKIAITRCVYSKIYKIVRHRYSQIFDQAEIKNQNNQLVWLSRASKLAFNVLRHLWHHLSLFPKVTLSPVLH